jgi:hypothetical protein
MRRLFLLTVMFMSISALPAAAATVIVDGTSNTIAVAENETQPWVAVTPGSLLRFSTTGSVQVDSGGLYYGADGGITSGYSYTANTKNLSGITAPWGALVGVFVDSALEPVPTVLDFSDSASRNFAVIAPSLQQTFFIGDGTSNTLLIQETVVPAGATRLYLGVHDSSGSWGDNLGSFTVDVVPVPGAFWLLGSGLMGLFGVRRLRRS